VKIQIKNVSILQTSKVIAILYAVFGLLFIPCGCIFTLIGAGSDEPGLTISGIVYIFFPIIYLVFGFIGTAILAWVYNLLSDRTGGIEFELEDVEGSGVLEPPTAPVE
jgi:hypothetical protein